MLVVAAKPLAALLQTLVDEFAKGREGATARVQEGDFRSSLSHFAAAGDYECVLALDYTLDASQWRKLHNATTPAAVAYPFAIGAVVFVAHESNPLTSLTLDDVRGIYNHKIARWAQLGVQDFPAGDDDTKKVLIRHVPRDNLAYRTILHIAVLGRQALTPGLVRHDNYRDVAHAVSEAPPAIGIVGFGYQGSTKVLPVKPVGSDIAVLPTRETIRSREYPLAHYAYLYFAKAPTGIARDFLQFAQGEDGQAIVDRSNTGLVSLPFADSR